ASLFTQKSPYAKLMTPLAMGCLGPGNVLGPDRLDQNKIEWDAVFHGRRQIDDHAVFGIEFRNSRDKKTGQSIQFFLDPAQGYLPFRVHCNYASKPIVNGHPKKQVFLMQARECGRERWFPERTLIIYTPDKAGDVYDVREIKVLELDVDARPREDEFTIEVPVGTPIQEEDEPSKGFFRLKQDEKINVKDLPSLFDMLDKAKTTPLMDTAVPHKPSRAWLRWAGGCVGGLLILTAVVLLLRRRIMKELSNG